MKKLPIYKLIISEEDTDKSEVNYVALVDQPAIERTWLTFNNRQRFLGDKERRIISGPLMIADLPIYRRDEKGEYYVVFDKPTIEKIVQKYFRKGYTSNVNMMHEADKPASGVYMFESILIDKERGIEPPKGFEDLTDGSWYGSFKVDNEEIWNEFIKTGIFKGFSVEGIFDYEYEETSKEADILDIIKDILG